jgi:hypothetical protein
VKGILAYARMTRKDAGMARKVTGITKMDGNRYF